jgi:hypothetical protein
MALPKTIDSTTPAATDLISNGDDQIRALKAYIVDVFGVPDGSSVTVGETRDGAGYVGVNESTNGEMTIGITINQAGNDDQVLAFKSSDVTSPFTTQAEADTYARFLKATAAEGGLLISGFASNNIGMHIEGHADATDIVDTDTTSDVGVVLIDCYEDTGTTRQAVTTGNIFCVRNGTTARLLLKEDGELHIGNDTPVTLADSYVDAELCRVFDYVFGKPETLIKSKWDEFVRYNMNDLIEAGIIGNPGEETSKSKGMWNISQHVRLLNGAVWQLYSALKDSAVRTEKLEQKLALLEKGKVNAEEVEGSL